MHSSDYITGYESGLESKAGDESEVVFKARFESYVGSRNCFEVGIQKRVYSFQSQFSKRAFINQSCYIPPHLL